MDAIILFSKSFFNKRRVSRTKQGGRRRLKLELLPERKLNLQKSKHRTTPRASERLFPLRRVSRIKSQKHGVPFRKNKQTWRWKEILKTSLTGAAPWERIWKTSMFFQTGFKDQYVHFSSKEESAMTASAPSVFSGKYLHFSEKPSWCQTGDWRRGFVWFVCPSSSKQGVEFVS